MADTSNTNLIDSIVVGTQRNVFTLPYAVCTTEGREFVKIVECDNFVLATGAMIAIKFAFTHTASTMALNINDGGNIAVQYNEDNVDNGKITLNNVYMFIYDGTYFRLLGVNTDTNTDTKVSSTNSTSKLFLVGTTTQASGGQTGYSNAGCYASGGALYSEGTKVSLTGHKHTEYASISHTHSNYASSSHTHTSQNYPVNFGTCSSTAASSIKIVAITGITGTPSAGTRITVRFTQANSATTPTLRVDNGSTTGTARSIKSPSSNLKWCTGAIIDFVYYSSTWYMMSPTPTAYYTTSTTTASGGLGTS